MEREGLSNPSVNIGAEEDIIDTLTHLDGKIIAKSFEFQTNNYIFLYNFQFLSASSVH